MASSENLEKRAEELFETLTDEDLENPKVFLDKKRRDIQNQAKELVKDIDDIIKCLENYHKTCGAFRTVGHMADASGTVRFLAATALCLLTGGPASAVLALARTAAVATSFAGMATSTVATAAEAFLEKKQVKSVREKMETLKGHIRDYVLYSDMLDQFVAASRETMGKLQASGESALAAGRQLLERSAAKASAQLFGRAVVFGSIYTLCLTIYNLVSEIKELDQGKQTEVMKHLQVLKHDLEDIAQGKF